MSMTRNAPGRLSRWGWLKVGCATAAVLIAGCGGGGDASGSGTGGTGSSAPTGAPGADYFPLSLGDRWVYAESSITGGSTQRVSRTQAVGGGTAFVVQYDDATQSYEDFYLKSAAGVSVVPGPGSDAFTVALGEVQLLRLPIVGGDRYVAIDKSLGAVDDYDRDGRPDTVALRAEVTVVGFETLDTVAGTLANVAHLRTLVTTTVTLAASGERVVLTTTSDDWYAPDVGPVRSQTVTTAPGVNDSSSQTLRAYRVGSRRSETVAPTVAARSPAAGGTLRNVTFSVAFSEAMDRPSSGSGGLVVTGPDGRAVVGTATWQDERTLTFVPAGVLASGGYSAAIATSVQDLAGNSVAEPNWSFTVDRQGPLVVALSPAADAVEVPLSSVIRITFDEAPAAASINAGTVQLSDRTGQLLAATRVLDGRTLTVTPAQPFARGGTYTLQVWQVADALGNVNSNATTARFKADPGRFGAPQSLPGLALVGSVAITDINGDGRSDLVVTGSTSNLFDQVTRVWVYRQQADGTLAAPETAPLQSSCAVMGLTTADVDGDGRSDVIVSHFCGFEILRQTAAGTLVSTTAISSSQTTFDPGAVRVGGRTSLLALVPALPLGSGSAELRLWRQDADGAFAAPVLLPPVLSTAYRFTVADIDGDGRDDIVLWGLLSSNDAYGVAIVYQRSDGSFGGAREIAMPTCGGNNDVSAGDVNGDGRTDLVLLAPCHTGDRVAVLLQGAGGDFSSSLLASATNLQRAKVADINGDGRADVVTVHSSYGIGIYLQHADGSLGPQEFFEASSAWGDPVVGDINGDGRADVVLGTLLFRQRLFTAMPNASPATGLAASASAALGTARSSLVDLPAWQPAPRRSKYPFLRGPAALNSAR